MTSRVALWVGLLAVALGGCLFQVARTAGAGTALPLYDFAEYWAAGRLNLAGDNPYDPLRMDELERAAGRDCEPILMWNPPWALTLVMPFGLLPAAVAHKLWLALQFLVLLYAADAAWLYFGGSASRRGVAWLLAFTFLPSFLCLYLGQVSSLLLLGAVLFLQGEQWGRPLRTGAGLVLLSLKPHLVFLFWVALILWVWQRRRWDVLAGAALAGLLLLVPALVCNPAVLGQYVHAVTTHPPAQYRSPTLGTVLRLLLGADLFGLQFLALLPGLAWFVPWWLSQRRTWDWGRALPVLLLVSMLTTLYGAWPFDLVLLLVPVLQVAVAVDRDGSEGRARSALLLHLALNGLAAWLLVRRTDFFWFLWMTPALLLAYLALQARARRARAGLPAPLP